MSENSPAISPSLVARVKGLIVNPAAEWEVIAAEHQTINSLFTGYAVILAAIGPVCGLIAATVFRHGLVGALVGALIGYALTLIGTYVVGLIINLLSPYFGGAKDPVAAMKVAVYSMTPAWVAGVFQLIPFVGGVLAFLAAIYGLYVLYLGLPRLMRSPEAQSLPFTIVTIIASIVIWAAVAAVTTLIVGMLALGSIVTGSIVT